MALRHCRDIVKSSTRLKPGRVEKKGGEDSNFQERYRLRRYSRRLRVASTETTVTNENKRIEVRIVSMLVSYNRFVILDLRGT